MRLVACSALALLVVACAEIGSSPTEATAIEFDVFPAPSVVLNDSMRDVDGVAMPIHATVRNVRGDIIANAGAYYLYADATRDAAITVDSTAGYVFAAKTTVPAGATARLAARIGSVLQVVKAIVVTLRPDSADRGGTAAVATLTTTRPDTNAISARANTSAPLNVVVRNVDATGAAPVLNGVNAWRVKFVLLQPANANNDTTQSVFLVDDVGKPSVLDTTDANGTAARSIRVRANLFPTTTAVDSVIVQANVTYKGKNLKGAPIRIAVPVKQGTGS